MTREEIFEESGRRGENRVEQVLESAYSGCFIHNVLFRYYGFISEICSMEIDYICILKKHVYVIEVKNWNTITKYDSRKDEYHVLINKVNRHFKSPIYQNVGHRELLSQLFNISEDRIVCISVICTDDDSAHKYVRDRNPKRYEKSHVIKIEDLIQKIEAYEKLVEEDVEGLEDIWGNIERANWASEEIYRANHEEYCKKVKRFLKQGLSFPKFMKCDECGGIIVLGEKEGNYFGKCTNFPKSCKRKTIAQADFEQYVVQEWFKEGRIIYKMSIVEYENEIKKKRGELEKLEALIQEIELKPEWIRNEEYEEVKSINGTLQMQLLNSQEEQQKQEKKISTLLVRMGSMKDELTGVQKEKDILLKKYEKTLRYKMEKMIEKILGRADY